jgi:glutamyl-tRNA reductase
VATNAPTPIILKSHLEDAGTKLIIDLSIPNNVEQTVKELPGLNLVNIDELSKLNGETLQKRIAEVPKVSAIINEHKSEFLAWSDMRKNAPIIYAAKQKLNNMHQCPIFSSAYTAISSARFELNLADEQSIKRIIKNMALKMRKGYYPGCSYIEAINDFITAHVN